MRTLSGSTAAKRGLSIILAAACPYAWSATGVLIGHLTTINGDIVTTGHIDTLVNGATTACAGGMGIPDDTGFYTCTLNWAGTSGATVVAHTVDTGFIDQTSGNLALAADGQTTYNFILELPDEIFEDGFEIAAAF
jgi:ethanolamine utilization microcompartment shell protein EutS